MSNRTFGFLLSALCLVLLMCRPVCAQAVTVTTYQLGTGLGPFATAVDTAGNLYVANNVGKTIMKLTSGGTLSTIASGLASPIGITYDAADGNLYVLDQGSNGYNTNLYRMTTSGALTLVAGGYYTASNGSEMVTTDSAGNIYVANGNGQIYKITTGGVNSLFATISGCTSYSIRAIAFDTSGNLYATDAVNNRILKISPSGSVSTLTSSVTAPQDIAIDSSGNVYTTSLVARANYSTVYKTTPSGASNAFASSMVLSLTIDPSNNIYVDASGPQLQRISPSGAVTVLATSANGYSADSMLLQYSTYSNAFYGIQAWVDANSLVHNAIVKVTTSNCPIAIGTPPSNSNAFDLLANLAIRLVNALGFNFCVTNTSANHYFIPANTSTELQSFYNAASNGSLSGVTVSSP